MTLTLQGVPVVPAYANETYEQDVAIAATDGEQDGDETGLGEEDLTYDAQEAAGALDALDDDETYEQSASDVEYGGSDVTVTVEEPQPVGAEDMRVLATEFVTSEGRYYHVEARFADDEGIPLDVVLSVEELRVEPVDTEQPIVEPCVGERFVTDSDLELRQMLLDAALGIDEHDCSTATTFIDVALLEGDARIELAEPVELTITTDAIAPKRATTVQAVLLDNTGLHAAAQALDQGFDARQLAEQLENQKEYQPLQTEGAILGETFDEAELVTVSIATERLGELGLAWDSGYRDTILDMSPVTVEGAMPEGTLGEVLDVTNSYPDPTALVDEADTSLDATKGEADDVLATLVAYDITLTADGKGYDPDAGHPLTVTFTDRSIVQDKDLQLWHVLDDGTIEVVDHITIEGNALTFETTSLGSHIVVERMVRASTKMKAAPKATATLEAQPQDNETLGATRGVTLSKSFNIRGQRDSAARTTTVTFVDQFGTAINGTVSGTVYLNYADGKTDYPNMVDMYSYEDCLDPSLVGKYEFSRVYLTLGNDPLGNDEKEFRYFLVSTDYDIHGKGGTATRLYTYMTDPKVDTASTGVYNGMWYTLPNSDNRAADKTYIEFNRVSEVSFKALTQSGEPVEGAEFTLYSDPNCYREFEYKGSVVKATSDSTGLVSFGKLPYNDNNNTYYMKETLVPQGYKDTGMVYEVKAQEGVTNPTIYHDENDGSLLLTNVKSMHVKVTWADGEDAHKNDVATVKVFSQNVEKASAKLKYGAWETTFNSLKHTIPYVVTEPSIMRGENDILDKWIPQISYVEHDPTIGYYKAEEFQQGKEYVLATTEGKALITSGGKLSTSAVTVEDDMMTSDVNSTMLWRVESISNDGVITLRNVSSGRSLNYVNSAWTADTGTSQFVRHAKYGGNVFIYYRTNLNASRATYLVVGDTMSTTGDYTKASNFNLYQQVEVHAVTVTVRNVSTVYPVRIQNMVYYTDEALPGGTYALYTDSEFEGHLINEQPVLEDMEPVYDEVHEADGEGYLTAQGSREFKLWADTYYLVQKSTPSGYLPAVPAWVKFTVTRDGTVRVDRSKEQFPDYTYVSSDVEGDTTYRKLRVPNQRLTTVTLQKDLVDDTLDEAAAATLRFGFEARLSDATGRPVKGWTFVDGSTTNDKGIANLSVTANSQSALQVPLGDILTLSETSYGYAVKVAQDDGAQARARSYSFVVPGESRVTFTNIKPICKIEDDGVEHPFESLNAAVEYARENMAGERATIEMLVDYRQPQWDAVTFAQGDDIVLTTADKPSSGSDKIYHYSGQGQVATITRAYAGQSMLGGCGTLTLSNITLDGNRETYGQLALNGGIVSWSAGSLVLGEGSTITNAAVVSGLGRSGLGGAVYVSGTATLTMTGAAVTNCAAVCGGGVYVSSASDMNMTDGEVSGCTATEDGGALWVGSGASLSLAGTATVENNMAGSRGGGLYAEGAEVSLTNAYVGSATGQKTNSISHNTAGEGGGIYFDALGSNRGLTLSNGASIRSCTAQTGSGGAIYCKGGTVQLVDNAEIVAGSAAVSGGGIYATGGADVVLDGPCDHTSTTAMRVYDCRAGRAGGCVALEDNSGSSLSVLRGSAVLMGTVTDSGGQGGGVYAGVGTTVLLDGSGAMPRNGKTEPAYIAWSRTESGQGGGLYAASGSVVTLVNGGQIVNNGTSGNNVSRTAQGGGVYVADGATLSVTAGSQVAKNEAGEGGGMFVTAGGTAALSSDDETLAANVRNNRAGTNGAGIYLSPEGKLKLSGLVTVTENATGTGNLYLPAGVTGSEVEVTGDLTDGSVIYVWAQEANRDGRQVTVDEPFGITTSDRSRDVAGLSSFVSQRAEEENEQVLGMDGIGNAVVWGKRATVEVRLETLGNYADLTKEFDFKLTLPEGVTEVKGSVDGVERTFTPSDNSLRLAHGQVLVLEGIQAYLPHVIAQTSSAVAAKPKAGDKKYDTTARVVEQAGSTSTLTLEVSENDARVLTINKVVGTANDPARLVVSNTLDDDDVPQTGIDDNALVWLGIVVGAGLGIMLLFGLRRRKNTP
ncbi:MAG: SpaA isopeptide-forming pilin-related protein [Atopobiaceae bacterium]|nr:SpaA isopeptide-forming pilin-related protein [Atopobiaceae bacterium]